MRVSLQRAGPQVEHPLVAQQLAVANVEWLVVDQQAQDLAVGDVDDRLPGLRVAVAGLRIRQRPDLVERVQIRAGQAVRLAFVEVAANSDVPVGQREQRLRLRQHIEVQMGLADLPGLDGKGVFRDHRGAYSSSARSVTTTSAPCWRSASAWPTRSTPTTYPKWPARPASTPESASSNTAAAAASTPSSWAARKKESGAGLPAMCSSRRVTPSTRCWMNFSRPVISSTWRVLALEETTAVARPAAATFSR